MDMRKVGFLRSTYTRIKEFIGGIKTIRQSYPTVTLEEIRRYIHSSDMGGLPAELCTAVDHLEAIREQTIRDEMVFLSTKANAKGKTVPDDLLNGTALDPLLSPSVYDIAQEFQVFECFSWYSPEEAACFEPREL